MIARLLPAAAASLLLLGTAAAPVWAAPFDAPQEEEIRRIVRDYLIANPDVVVEALQEYRRREEAARAAATGQALAASRDALLRNAADPVGGNAGGDVTVVEFFDYNCGWCKRAYSHLLAAVEADGGLRVVFKEYPILAPSSRLAARAALAAARQGKYRDMHDRLMSHPGALDEDAIMAHAAAAGLDMPRLRADMAAPEVEAAIEANLALAEKIGVRGTPAFVIGDRLFPGMMETGGLLREIGRAREDCAARKAAVC